MNELRQNKGICGGPSGARSRDLRIKRPRCHGARNALFSGIPCIVASYSEPPANQRVQKPPFRPRILGVTTLEALGGGE